MLLGGINNYYFSFFSLRKRKKKNHFLITLITNQKQLKISGAAQTFHTSQPERVQMKSPWRVIFEISGGMAAEKSQSKLETGEGRWELKAPRGIMCWHQEESRSWKSGANSHVFCTHACFNVWNADMQQA